MFTGDEAYPLSFGVNADVLEAFGIVPLSVRKYGDTWKLHTEAGDLALRCVSDAGRLQAAFEMAEHLSRRGDGREVSRFVRSRFNDPFVRDGSRVFYLTSWVPGAPVDVAQSGHAVGVLQTLSDWHHAARGASLSRTGEAGFKEWFERGCTAVEQVAARVKAQSSSDWLVQALRTVADELRDAKEELDAVSWWDRDRTAREDKWICHGKMDRRHVRYDGERYRLFNYEHVRFGHPLSDAARFLQDVMPLHDWNAEALATLADAYCSRWQEDDDGVSVLAGLLQIPFQVVEQVQQISSDEMGIDEISDLLEYELFHAEAKRRAITTLATERNREETPASDIVHAQLQEQGNAKQKGIEVAGLRRGVTEPGAGSRTRKVTIRKYRPKPDAPVSPSGPGGPQLFHESRRPDSV